MAAYHLIEDDDKILVGLSGGKDSLLLTELLAKRARIQHPRFTVEAIHVRMENIHYETDTSYLQQFCDNLGVKLHVRTTSFDVISTEQSERRDDKGDVNQSDVPPVTSSVVERSHEISPLAPLGRDDKGDRRRQKQPCFLCSWNRRKQLFNLAQELGCNKIALGHHQDDIIHTALMNLTFQAHFSTMPVRLKMRKMPLTIIRPLCLIPESDIKTYAEMQGYEKQQKLCPYETGSHRTDIKEIYERMEALNPEVRYNIWRALETDNKLIEES